MGIMDHVEKILDTDREMGSDAAEKVITDQFAMTLDEYRDFVISDNKEQTEKIQEISEVGDWLDDINPNYTPYDVTSPYVNNCGACAFSVSERLDGNTDITAGPDNIGTEEGMAAFTGHEFAETTPEDIELRLIEEGPGAHVIVGIDREYGPGHWFNAYCPDGKNVYALDGQCNTIQDWPPHGLGDVSRWVVENKEG